MIGISASQPPDARVPMRTPLPQRTRLVLIVAGLIGAVYPIIEFVKAAANPNVNGIGGIDYSLYMEATRRWLSTGVFYEPYQLAGPYPIEHGDVLYSPNSLLLFIPFTLLPAFLWWAIPLGTTIWAMLKMRPSLIAWPLIAFCLAWPPTLARAVAGNPVMWVVAALALGCLYRWPSVGVLLKPSLFPFALIGIRDRRWWLALAVSLVLALPFGTMWIDWVRAVANSQGGGLAYSFQDIPILMIPILAWKLR
jgi:hypothetical protein